MHVCTIYAANKTGNQCDLFTRIIVSLLYPILWRELLTCIPGIVIILIIILININSGSLMMKFDHVQNFLVSDSYVFTYYSYYILRSSIAWKQQCREERKEFSIIGKTAVYCSLSRSWLSHIYVVYIICCFSSGMERPKTDKTEKRDGWFRFFFFSTYYYQYIFKKQNKQTWARIVL